MFHFSGIAQCGGELEGADTSCGSELARAPCGRHDALGDLKGEGCVLSGGRLRFLLWARKPSPGLSACRLSRGQRSCAVLSPQATAGQGGGTWWRNVPQRPAVLISLLLKQTLGLRCHSCRPAWSAQESARVHVCSRRCPDLNWALTAVFPCRKSYFKFGCMGHSQGWTKGATDSPSSRVPWGPQTVCTMRVSWEKGLVLAHGPSSGHHPRPRLQSLPHP